MTTILIVLHVVVCLFLISIVLLQHGKGADIGATFGGSNQSLFGTEGPLPLLNKITTLAAIVFMGTSVTLAYISANQSSGSVMRDMPVQGFDAFECTHDVQNFDKRLRVTRTPTPRPPARTLAVAGFDALQSAAPDLRAGRHYIRPDGNAEQYRKGAPQ